MTGLTRAEFAYKERAEALASADRDSPEGGSEAS